MTGQSEICRMAIGIPNSSKSQKALQKSTLDILESGKITDDILAQFVSKYFLEGKKGLVEAYRWVELATANRDVIRPNLNHVHYCHLFRRHAVVATDSHGLHMAIANNEGEAFHEDPTPVLDADGRIDQQAVDNMIGRYPRIDKLLSQLGIDDINKLIEKSSPFSLAGEDAEYEIHSGNLFCRVNGVLLNIKRLQACMNFQNHARIVTTERDKPVVILPEFPIDMPGTWLSILMPVLL